MLSVILTVWFLVAMPRSRPPVCRCLFGRPDPDTFLQETEETWQRLYDEAASRWDFDFRACCPLTDMDGKSQHYEWTPVDTCEYVPSVYNKMLKSTQQAESHAVTETAGGVSCGFTEGAAEVSHDVTQTAGGVSLHVTETAGGMSHCVSETPGEVSHGVSETANSAIVLDEISATNVNETSTATTSAVTPAATEPATSSKSSDVDLNR